MKTTNREPRKTTNKINSKKTDPAHTSASEKKGTEKKTQCENTKPTNGGGEGTREEASKEEFSDPSLGADGA